MPIGIGSPRSWFVAARWMLLTVVLVGLLGMHVLTGGDGLGHGSVPVTVVHHDDTPDSPAGTDPAARAPWAAGQPTELPPMSGHGAMAGCVLFLALGGGLILLLALRRRIGETGTANPHEPARRVPREPRRRGPPALLPRVALGVIRV